MKNSFLWLCLTLVLFSPEAALASLGKPLRIAVFGDSLVAGYGLDNSAAFPARLEARLKQRGYSVEVINAGVSGDTSAGGLARLDWTLAAEPDLMIVELGANDALRGVDPAETKENLHAILTRLQERGIQPLLAGMKAPRNLGESYYTKFDQLYPALAQRHQVPLYPFILAGVAGEPDLNLADGIHPNAAGVEVMVAGMLPLVEAQLEDLMLSRATQGGTPAGGLEKKL